jgi:hypothetical protein
MQAQQPNLLSGIPAVSDMHVDSIAQTSRGAQAPAPVDQASASRKIPVGGQGEGLWINVQRPCNARATACNARFCQRGDNVQRPI